MTTEAITPEQTRVSWGFAGHMPYPMNLMLLVMDVESIIAADLQQGLDNLKLILEAPPAPQNGSATEPKSSSPG